MARLCKDCKWCELDRAGNLTHSTCTHPKVSPTTVFISAVTGDRETSTKTQYCCVERKFDAGWLGSATCGKQGKLYREQVK